MARYRREIYGLYRGNRPDPQKPALRPSFQRYGHRPCRRKAAWKACCLSDCRQAYGTGRLRLLSFRERRMADKGSSRGISSKTSAGSINSYQKMREYPHSSRTSRFQYAMISTASKIIPPNPQSVSESGVFVLKDDKPINSGSPSQIPKAYFLLKTHSLKCRNDFP